MRLIRSAREFECPTCGAVPGQKCWTLGSPPKLLGLGYEVHRARKTLARGGAPPAPRPRPVRQGSGDGWWDRRRSTKLSACVRITQRGWRCKNTATHGSLCYPCAKLLGEAD